MQENIDLRDYGYRDSGTPDIARITAVFKNRYDLITPTGANAWLSKRPPTARGWRTGPPPATSCA